MKKEILVADIVRILLFISVVILGVTVTYLMYPQENVNKLLVLPFICFGCAAGYHFREEQYTITGNKMLNILMIFGSIVFLAGIFCLLQQAVLINKLFSGYLLFLGCAICLLIIAIFLFARNISLIDQRIYHDESL